MKAHKKVFITESDVRREVKRFLFYKDYIIKRKLLKNKYCRDGKFVFKET